MNRPSRTERGARSDLRTSDDARTSVEVRAGVASRTRGGRRGFTLIEILTVMAVISILIAVLLPSLSGARNRARITKCQSNLRELAGAALRYISQHDDRIPMNADCRGGFCAYWNGHQYFGWNGTTLNPHGNVWVRYMNRELGLELVVPNSMDARIALCPGDTGAPGQTGVNDRLYDVLGTSYPMNPILCQGRVSDWKYRDRDLSMSQVIQPSLKVLVADHVAFGLTYDAFWTAIRPGWHDRLRPAAVVGFMDGHADYVSGRGNLREWQWYGDATGTQFVRDLRRKIDWTVYPDAE